MNWRYHNFESPRVSCVRFLMSKFIRTSYRGIIVVRFAAVNLGLELYQAQGYSEIIYHFKIDCEKCSLQLYWILYDPLRLEIVNID